MVAAQIPRRPYFIFRLRIMLIFNHTFHFAIMPVLLHLWTLQALVAN